MKRLTVQQTTDARRVLRNFYHLDAKEADGINVQREVDNLARRFASGNMDDAHDKPLYSLLRQHAGIEFPPYRYPGGF